MKDVKIGSVKNKHEALKLFKKGYNYNINITKT